MADGPGRAWSPVTPLWVKVLGLFLIALVLLLVILALFGGGQHGPGRHIPSGPAGGQAPPVERGVPRP